MIRQLTRCADHGPRRLRLRDTPVTVQVRISAGPARRPAVNPEPDKRTLYFACSSRIFYSMLLLISAVFLGSPVLQFRAMFTSHVVSSTHLSKIYHPLTDCIAAHFPIRCASLLPFRVHCKEFQSRERCAGGGRTFRLGPPDPVGDGESCELCLSIPGGYDPVEFVSPGALAVFVNLVVAFVAVVVEGCCCCCCWSTWHELLPSLMLRLHIFVSGSQTFCDCCCRLFWWCICACYVRVYFWIR